MRVRRHQPAQVIILLPVAALMLLGMAALAIDGGRFFMGRQDLQNAAEAAALNGAIDVALRHPTNPDPASWPDEVQAAVNASVTRSLGVAKTICQPSSLNVRPVKYQGRTLDGTNVNAVYVHISCIAQFSAAAIIPDISNVANLSLGAEAQAVLGSFVRSDPSRKFVPYDPYDPLKVPFPRLLPRP